MLDTAASGTWPACRRRSQPSPRTSRISHPQGSVLALASCGAPSSAMEAGASDCPQLLVGGIECREPGLARSVKWSRPRLMCYTFQLRLRGRRSSLLPPFSEGAGLGVAFLSATTSQAMKVSQVRRTIPAWPSVSPYLSAGPYADLARKFVKTPWCADGARNGELNERARDGRRGLDAAA